METRTPVREFKARAGDLLCLRPVEWSEYRTLANTIMYQITVAFAPAPFELATPLLPGLGVLPVHVRLGKFVDPVRRAFETICVELPQASLRSQLRWKAAIYQLLEAVAAALTGNVEEHRQVDQWEAVRFKLTSVDGSKADIAGLARDMGYSAPHFRKLFKQRFGLTAQHCQMAARLQEAIHRLREEKEGIKSIAHSLGFSGAKGLTRSIQKHLGLTASQIRQRPGQLPSLSQAMLEPFALNRHILPPGDSLDRLLKRYAPAGNPSDFTRSPRPLSRAERRTVLTAPSRPPSL